MSLLPQTIRDEGLADDFDRVGSTRYVDFDTTRPTYRTDPKRCPVSHVVADTGSWEQKMAETLEDMEKV